jgi:hypothetical protein
VEDEDSKKCIHEFKVSGSDGGQNGTDADNKKNIAGCIHRSDYNGMTMLDRMDVKKNGDGDDVRNVTGRLKSRISSDGGNSNDSTTMDKGRSTTTGVGRVVAATRRDDRVPRCTIVVHPKARVIRAIRKMAEGIRTHRGNSNENRTVGYQGGSRGGGPRTSTPTNVMHSLGARTKRVPRRRKTESSLRARTERVPRGGQSVPRGYIPQQRAIGQESVQGRDLKQRA